MEKESSKLMQDEWRDIISNCYYNIIPKMARDPSKFVLSKFIVCEAINRFLDFKETTENLHPAMDGTESCKIAGYLTYWIAKLKPVQTFEKEPNIKELFINEYLAIFVALTYFKERGKLTILNEKIIRDLRYTLRYRTLTVRVIPIIYDAYIAGFNNGADKVNETLQKYNVNVAE